MMTYCTILQQCVVRLGKKHSSLETKGAALPILEGTFCFGFCRMELKMRLHREINKCLLYHHRSGVVK